MKRKSRFFLLVFCLIVLNCCVVCDAKDYSVSEEPLISDFKLDKIENYKLISNIKSSIIVENVQCSDNNSIAMFSEETSKGVTDEESSDIYYGTVTGKLSQKDDYALYPVDLSQNEYLQAKLSLPIDDQIDYDLLLFDDQLSLIKSSDYLTCTSGSGTLAESIGYIAKQDEKIYVCVYSVLGGNDTQEYTLDYTVTTNFFDSTEPDENAKDAETLTMTKSGINMYRKLNSPLDNDWYSFTVFDGPEYERMRLCITSSPNKNGYNLELYKNIETNGHYAMVLVGSGNAGEVDLESGIYYLRVVSTNSFEDFNAGDISGYHLTIAPVSKVDSIQIYAFDGPNAIKLVNSYPDGDYYRIDEAIPRPTIVTVIGQAWYKDKENKLQVAANAKVNGTIVDMQWEELSRPDLSTVYGSAITDEDGYFRMQVKLNSAVGSKHYQALISTHYYDLLSTTVSSDLDKNISDTDYFYLLKLSDYNGNR